MNPVYRMHFFDKRALADYGTDEVEAEGGVVVPVVRHHSANRHFLVDGWI